MVRLVALSYISVHSSSMFSAGTNLLIHDIPVTAIVGDHKVLHQQDINATTLIGEVSNTSCTAPKNQLYTTPSDFSVKLQSSTQNIKPEISISNIIFKKLNELESSKLNINLHFISTESIGPAWAELDSVDFRSNAQI